ncbi:MAG: membrane protein insertase YidC, partial [Bacteroidota bacterium]
MDKNNIVGLVLIFGLLMAWSWWTLPSPEQIQAEQRMKDSLAMVARQDSLAKIAVENATATQAAAPVPDSVMNEQLAGIYGPFSAAATGTESESVLENDLIKVTFSNKGGRIKEVLLKEYHKIEDDEEGNETKIPLKLLEDEKNKFEYFLPIANLPSGSVKTSDLFFKASQSGNKISFRADAGNGRFFEHSYELGEKYGMDYTINLSSLNGLLDNSVSSIKLNWINYLDKLEKNTQYERGYSSIYYKELEDDPTYCSCRADDLVEETMPLKWLSHSNQFFNSALIAETSFNSDVLETRMLDEDNVDLKYLRSELEIPLNTGAGEFKMTMYNGPNEFKRLASYGHSFEDVIPFGWSIFGTINRWVIRPVFNFLSSFIGNAGIVILVLTLLVKLLLYPLTYKMLYSQAKMGALKPQLAKLKEKYGEDQTEMQKQSMKLYGEFGVNPLGGCMPMVLQMPIWFALYRFFPASIEFRQAGFLWATDLSSYDVFAQLPFEIPFYGSHVSMFTILWAVTTVIYTYYNSKQMDMAAMNNNPMMKYMQYGMPVMFLFFFNSFASGLTCYLFFSNLFNITQTLVTKNYIINHDKVKAELEANKKKPKKQGGFRDRLQKALEEQQ